MRNFPSGKSMPTYKKQLQRMPIYSRLDLDTNANTCRFDKKHIFYKFNTPPPSFNSVAFCKFWTFWTVMQIYFTSKRDLDMVLACLKGNLTRDFRLHIFSWISSSRPLSISIGPFRIVYKNRGDIHKFLLITGDNDTSGKLFTSVKDTGDKLLVSLLPAIN